VTVIDLVLVIVTALVNGNDAVAVTDIVTESWIDQFRQHRNDAFEQLDATRVDFGVHHFFDAHDIEVRGALHRRTSGDRVVFRLVRSCRSTAALGDVLGDGLRRSTKLIGQVRVSLGQASTRSLGYHKELDRALIDIELLEVQH
jgi:hypothetical protein